MTKETTKLANDISLAIQGLTAEDYSRVLSKPSVPTVITATTPEQKFLTEVIKAVFSPIETVRPSSAKNFENKYLPK